MSNENKGSGKLSAEDMLVKHFLKLMMDHPGKGYSMNMEELINSDEFKAAVAAMEEYAAQQAPAGQCSICRGTGAYEKIVNGTFLGVFPCATCNGTGWLRSQQPAEPSPTNEEILQQTVKSQALTIEMLKSKAPSAGVSKLPSYDDLKIFIDEWMGETEIPFNSVAGYADYTYWIFNKLFTASSEEQPTKK